MSNTTTIRIDAAKYADHDDCLAAAAIAYVLAHPEAEGWDLNARWEMDGTRRVVDEDTGEYTILLDVPTA